MLEMENDIKDLDADLRAKMADLKLAHTRLENRTYRPGVDLCRDEVHTCQSFLSPSPSQHQGSEVMVGDVG